MGESESRPIIFETGIYYSSKEKEKTKTIIYFCVVFSLLFPPYPCYAIMYFFYSKPGRLEL